MIRLVRELVRALLQASDLYAVAARRLGSLRSMPQSASCPEDAICRHCPASYESDVCTEQERRAYELTLLYPRRRNGSSA